MLPTAPAGASTPAATTGSSMRSCASARSFSGHSESLPTRCSLVSRTADRTATCAGASRSRGRLRAGFRVLHWVASPSPRSAVTETAGIGSQLALKSAQGRWVVVATILGSGMASLDATVVNIALPHIGADLGGGLTSLQWTINAYTLTLAAFLLFGGSLGDRLGRRRIFVVGVVWFALASVGCALAPTSALLIGARALQG